jgi:hypothetical protein
MTQLGHFAARAWRAALRAFSGRINDVWQFSVNSLKLVCTSNPPRGLTLEGDMSAISAVSTRDVSKTQANFMNAIAVICGLGVVVLVCLATDGLDMSVGFF